MGMDQTVVFAGASTPGWEAVAALLHHGGFPVQLLMIDGELSFPDEAPPEGWRELRVGTPQGMVTLRHEPGRVQLVIWGNADAALRQAWNALTWAMAAAGNGQVQTAEGPVSADVFRRDAELPPTLT